MRAHLCRTSERQPLRHDYRWEHQRPSRRRRTHYRFGRAATARASSSIIDRRPLQRGTRSSASAGAAGARWQGSRRRWPTRGGRCSSVGGPTRVSIRLEIEPVRARALRRRIGSRRTAASTATHIRAALDAYEVASSSPASRPLGGRTTPESLQLLAVEPQLRDHLVEQSVRPVLHHRGLRRPRSERRVVKPLLRDLVAEDRLDGAIELLDALDHDLREVISQCVVIAGQAGLGRDPRAGDLDQHDVAVLHDKTSVLSPRA